MQMSPTRFSRELVLQCDPEGRILNADERAARLLGLSAGGDLLTAMVPGTEGKARALLQSLGNAPVRDWELSMLVEAASGPEGVQRAQELRPNVILLDFLLQESNAFDVLDELKADPRTRGIPVVIVTSHALDDADRDRLLQEADAIISKENLSRELAINRIRDALRKAGINR